MSMEENKAAPYEGGRFRLTSPYGMRTLDGVTAMHGGVDLVGLSSQTVCAVRPGTVVFAGQITDRTNRTWEWGNYVSVRGDDGCLVYYCHLSSVAVHAGDRVAAGQRLGHEGSTGYAFGAHLHLEVRENNQTQNAAAYIGCENREGIYRMENPLTETVTQLAQAVGFDDIPGAIAAMKELPHPYRTDFWRKVWEWGRRV